ncbi:ATP-binding protein [Kitasatospora sp. NPDC085464]|uniref:ATP-binding protein n=1 Tax=Kitasatospora sp. NPDC085464 TaxID=3364063 RepID=UPI0037CBD838
MTDVSVGTAPGDEPGDDASPQVRNTIEGGHFFGTVIQGRHVELRLTRDPDRALAGLPQRSSAFTGRDEELAALLAGLAPETVGRSPRVHVVAGLAGIGKTELAVQAADEALRRKTWFPGGVLFVDLLGYDPDRRLPPDHALDGWLRALGVPPAHIPPGVQDRSRLFRSVLSAHAEAGRPVLLVVDNAAGPDQVRPLLPGDGVTAAIVTSRDSLAVDARLHELTELGDRASVGLLAHAVRQARGEGDTRVADAPEDAAAVVRLCAGLPLALRIAGALLADSPDRPVSSLAEALAADHTRLERLQHADRAVRAAFDLSYGHLGAAHARLFRLLSLSPGPDFATESAAVLAGVDDVEAEQLLCDLSRAHLVEVAGVWGRWRMHDLVRLYADEQGRLPVHATADHRDAAQGRLHGHFTATVRAADSHLATLSGPPSPRFPDLATALAWLDAERPNLVALIGAAPPLGRPGTTTALALDLARYLSHRRHLDDWLDVTTTALELFRESADRHGEASALNLLGLALLELRRFDEARAAHTRAAAVFRALGHHLGRARALNNLGLALREERRFDEAIDTLTEAAAVYGGLGDLYGEAIVLSNLGATMREEGRFDDAVDAHSRAAATYARCHDRRNEARALNNLGLVLLEMRRFDEAIDTLTGAGSTFGELQDLHGEATVLTNLGAALKAAGRIEEAIAALTRAVEAHRALHDRHREGGALNNLGLAQQRAGLTGAALNSFGSSAALFRELGDDHNAAKALTNRERVRAQGPPSPGPGGGGGSGGGGADGVPGRR